MKATIKRSDGVVIEAEGTPEEILKLVPLQFNFIPPVWITAPAPFRIDPLPNPIMPAPWNPDITWTVGDSTEVVGVCNGVDAVPALNLQP